MRRKAKKQLPPIDSDDATPPPSQESEEEEKYTETKAPSKKRKKSPPASQESEEESPETRPRGKKKRKRSDPVSKIKAILDNEESLRDFLATHPELFDKTNENFYKKAHKEKLYDDKAKELGGEEAGVTRKVLERWQRLIRDGFVRAVVASKGRSGDGAKVLSDRQKYLLNNFQFLRRHISRMKGKTAGLGDSDDSDDDSEDLEFQNSDPDATITLDDSPRSPSPPPTKERGQPTPSISGTKKSKGKGKGKATPSSTPAAAPASSQATVDMVKLLAKMIDQPPHAATPQPQPEYQSPEDVWGLYLKTSNAQMHPEVMGDWKAESGKLTETFLARSRWIQTRDGRMSAVPTPPRPPMRTSSTWPSATSPYW